MSSQQGIQGLQRVCAAKVRRLAYSLSEKGYLRIQAFFASVSANEVVGVISWVWLTEAWLFEL